MEPPVTGERVKLPEPPQPRRVAVPGRRIGAGLVASGLLAALAAVTALAAASILRRAEDSTDTGPRAMTCEATWYDSRGATASGEPFDPRRLAAASHDVPLGARVLVTNLRTQRSVVVWINDTSPPSAQGCVDLTRTAFGVIAPPAAGRVPVSVERLMDVPPETRS